MPQALYPSLPRREIRLLIARWMVRMLPAIVLTTSLLQAHVVPPEQFHPVVESYRRAMFLLNLNPVLWDEMKTDAGHIAVGLEAISQERADAYRKAVAEAIARPTAPVKEGEDAPGPDVRKEAARTVFELSTRAVADLLTAELEELKASTGDREAASKCLEVARQYWAGFEHEIKSTDQPMFREIGLCWLKIATALGSAPLLGAGEAPVDAKTIQQEADEILAYVESCYADFRAAEDRALAPMPMASKTFDTRAVIPAKLPPESNINKQRPRPRQILNLVARGVDETETPLVAFGDMVFDSSLIFGEPARSLGLSCNNCHNKGVTNPQFKIPGLTKYAGGLDVSSSFFAPHANNGHFDPLAFMMAHEQIGARPLLLEIYAGGKPTYHSCIWVRRDSGLKTLADLRGKSIAFADQVDMSGHIMPRDIFVRTGLLSAKRIEGEFFKQVYFAGGDEQAMRAMFNGFTDAAGVSQYALSLLRIEEREQVMPLANSIESPAHLLMARRDLPDEVASRVKHVLLALDRTNPADKAILDKLYGVQGYAETNLGDFAEVAKVAAAYGFVKKPELFSANPAKP